MRVSRSFELCRAFDLDAGSRPGKSRHCHRRPGWRVMRKVFRVDLAHRRVVGDLGEKDGAFGDALQAGPRRLERGPNVVECLARLSANTARDDVLGPRLDAGHAGDEDEVAGANGDRVRGDEWRQAWWIDRDAISGL